VKYGRVVFETSERRDKQTDNQTSRKTDEVTTAVFPRALYIIRLSVQVRCCCDIVLIRSLRDAGCEDETRQVRDCAVRLTTAAVAVSGRSGVDVSPTPAVSAQTSTKTPLMT